MEEDRDPKFDVIANQITQECRSDTLKKLNAFMRTLKRTESKSPDTMIIDPKSGSFVIQNDKLSEYFDYLNKARLESITMHHMERQYLTVGGHQQPSGIMIDIDIYQSSPNNFIDKSLCQKLGMKIMERMVEYVELGSNEPSVYMFFLMKPTIVALADKKIGTPGKEPPSRYNPRCVNNSEPGNEEFKCGFHILIPGVQLTKADKLFFGSRLSKDGVFNSIINRVDVTQKDKVFDTMSFTVPVTFLGSCKTGSNVAHELMFCFKYGLNTENEVYIIETDASHEFHGYNLVAELSLNFSIPGCRIKKTQCRIKPTYETQLRMYVEERTQKPDEEFDESFSCTSLSNPMVRDVKAYLEILSPERAASYKDWYAVVKAIRAIDPGLKDLAIWFSKRCPEKFDRTATMQIIDQIWAEVKSDGSSSISIGTIKYMAKEDNPEEYERVNSTNYYTQLIRHCAEDGGMVNHAFVARLLSEMFGDKFVVDKVIGRTRGTRYWYEFMIKGQHCESGQIYKWRRDTEPDMLSLYISDKLVHLYRSALSYFKDKLANAKEKAEIKALAKIVEQLKLSKNNLGNHGYKESVLRECDRYFMRPGFIKNLDTDPMLFGVGNGILKLGSPVKLITGFHTHLVSKYTQVRYVPYDEDNPKVKLVEKMFSDIIPEKDARDLILTIFASALDSRSKDPLLLLLRGPGANGKSSILELTLKLYGLDHYAKKLGLDLITGRDVQPGQADPTLMELKGINYGYISEPAADTDLKEHKVKSIISNETLTGRKLHSDTENFSNHAVIAVCSNFDFKVPCGSEGMWRRILFYYCPRLFKRPEDVDPENPMEIPKDPYFEKEAPNDPEFLEAYLSVLVKYYEIFYDKYHLNMDGMIASCRTIQKETANFRNRQDYINKFITEQMVESPSAEITLPDLIMKFMTWSQRMGIGIAADHESLSNKFQTARALSNFVSKNGRRVVMKGCRVLNISENPALGEKYIVDFMNEDDSVEKVLPDTNDVQPPKVSKYVVEEPVAVTDYKDDLFDDPIELREIDKTKKFSNMGTDEPKIDIIPDLNDEELDAELNAPIDGGGDIEDDLFENEYF